jgi:hypothetical protein
MTEGEAGMTEHSGASGPVNRQGMVIERTLHAKQHYPCHDMSLPFPLFQRGWGKDGLGVGD